MNWVQAKKCPAAVGTAAGPRTLEERGPDKGKNSDYLGTLKAHWGSSLSTTPKLGITRA